MLAALVEWTREEGSPPRSYDWDPGTARSQGLVPAGPMRWEREHPRWPSARTVASYFGSFSEALAAAGLEARRRRPELPLAERIAAAKRLAREGQSQARIAQSLGVSRRTVRDYLGAGSCPACGGPKVLPESSTCRRCVPARRWWPAWERTELLQALATWSDETGSRPSSNAWQPVDLGGEPKWEREYPRWPPHSLVAAEFGSWQSALEAAGLGLNRHNWSDEAILELIRAFYASEGRPPTRTDWQSTNDGQNPAGTLVHARFGSWSAALTAAGVPQNQHAPWAREEIVAALRRFAAEHARPPRTHDLQGEAVAAGGYPPAAVVHRAFGTFSEAVRTAGLEPGNPAPVSRDDALQALRFFRARHGRYPSASEWRRAGRRPGATTIIRRFGRWSKAIAAADRPPRQGREDP